MNNPTQIERYKQLVAYLEEHFREEINIDKVEAICHYSYRNINRIFQALHQETIGKYVKRLRLEKAAQHLKYSDRSVADIAFEVGFLERAAFSKAFKSRFGCTPSAFREYGEAQMALIQQSVLATDQDRQPLAYEVVFLPAFESLIYEYRGDFEDIAAVETAWEQLVAYAESQGVDPQNALYLLEIIDDNEISDQLKSRYHLSITLDRPLRLEPTGLYRVKAHPQQKYAKFIYQGTIESSAEFYQEIFAFWMQEVGLELADLPILEFYPDLLADSSSDQFRTEIYVPVH